jgi:deoxyribonuclease IV
MPTKQKLTVGFHVSTSDSIDLANDRAKEIGCTAFQIFTRNPHGWKYKELSDEKAENFRAKFKKFGFKACVAHMPYLPNIASPEKSIYNPSVKSLTAELERCTKLSVPYVVTHMGSHRGKGLARGLKQLTNACNQALSKTNDGPILLLENMAGQTNSVGSEFENIQTALDGITESSRAGVCFDTCHAFAAGYDLSSEEAVGATIDKLQETIGLNRLRVVHVNDSKGALNSHLDRHEHIGLGSIGEKGFKAFLSHKRVRDLPLIMETPDDDRRDDSTNLKVLFRLAG